MADINNSSLLCTHNNPAYIENADLVGGDEWSGCSVPSSSLAAPVLEACCKELGDKFEFTNQEQLQMFPETADDDVPCYTVCLTNTTEVYWADSQNVTDCVKATSESEEVDIDQELFRCAGPPMKTSDASASYRLGPPRFLRVESVTNGVLGGVISFLLAWLVVVGQA